MLYRAACITARNLRAAYYLSDDAEWASERGKGPPSSLFLVNTDIAPLLDDTVAALENAPRYSNRDKWRVLLLGTARLVLLLTSTREPGRYVTIENDPWRMFLVCFPMKVASCQHPAMQCQAATLSNNARDVSQAATRAVKRYNESVRNGADLPFAMTRDATSAPYFRWVSSP